jgi:hypothetical protein
VKYLLLILFLSLVTISASRAQSLSMSAGFELSQGYKPDAWQPLRVELRNESDRAIDGAIVVPISDPDAPSTMKLPVNVPARSSVRTTVWTYFPRPASNARQKQQSQPAISTAEWRGEDGALLSRAPVLGFPLSGKSGAEESDENVEMILLIDQRQKASDESFDAESLVEHLKESTGVAMSVASIGIDSLPRQSAGMMPIKAIVLEGVDPDSLDAAQQAALIEYLRGGGIVVLSAPLDSRSLAGSWMCSILPVQLIGTREASKIEVDPDASTLKLREPLPMVEALPGDGEVLLRSRDYVHVATKSIGLGRVIFTSFPINGLDESQPQAVALWEQLLSLKQPRRDWNQSALGTTRYQIIGGMIGKKVAPWRIAAAVAGGYLALVLAAQGMFFGAARPKAFATSVVVALLFTAVLVTMGMVRHSDQALQSATLAVTDIAPDGSSWRHESVAFVGAEKPNLSLESNERALVRPALADARNPPTVRQQPFMIEKAQSHTERIERVWEASAPAPGRLRLSAAMRIGANGIWLDVTNELGQPLQSPLAIINHRAFSMSDVPAGRFSIPNLRLNAGDDFSSAAVLTSDLGKRRAQIIQALVSPPLEQSAIEAADAPILVGWINAGDQPLIRTSSNESIESKSMELIRAPLQIIAPDPGTKLSIPSPLIKLNAGKLAYDMPKSETVPSQEIGNWVIAFAPMREIGGVKPARATLEARLSLPAHTLVIRKGQCVGGKPKMSPAGDVIAEWGGEVASKQIRFDCSPDDFDSDGCVYLMLEIRPRSQSASNAAAWQIKELGMSIDGQSIAAAKPIDLEPNKKMLDAETQQ